MDALLTRQTRKSESELAKAQEMHAKDIHENYKKILEGRGGSDPNGAVKASVAVKEAAPVVREPAAPVAPQPRESAGKPREAEYTPSAAERIASFERLPLKTNSAKNILFENVIYHNGELKGYELSSPRAATAAEEKPQTKAEVAPAPAGEAESEDARPTPRTMATLHGAAAMVQQEEEEEKVGFFAALGKRAKLVLAAVTFIVVLAIAIICINSSLINSLQAQIGELGEEAADLETRASQIAENIQDITSEESIAEWAIENGMTR